jgi:hypothetical protein
VTFLCIRRTDFHPPIVFGFGGSTSPTTGERSRLQNSEHPIHPVVLVDLPYREVLVLMFGSAVAQNNCRGSGNVKEPAYSPRASTPICVPQKGPVAVEDKDEVSCHVRYGHKRSTTSLSRSLARSRSLRSCGHLPRDCRNEKDENYELLVCCDACCV